MTRKFRTAGPHWFPHYWLALRVRRQIEAMRRDDRHLLCIDTVKALPLFKFHVWHEGKLESLQVLDWHEVAGIARWIGLAGSKSLLDQFECALINCAVLRLHPWGENGLEENACEALWIEEHKQHGRCIRWIKTCPCPYCNALPETVQDEENDPWCSGCNGTGTYEIGELLTDIEGGILEEEA